MRRPAVLLVIVALVAALVGVAPTAHAAPPDKASPTVFVGELTTDQLRQISDVGLDHGDLVMRGAAGDKFRVEVVLTPLQAAKLKANGLPLEEKRIGGVVVSRRFEKQAAEGPTVFRSYSEPGGIADELRALAEQYPRLTKLVVIGKTVQGKDILAIKLTADAKGTRDGKRPQCSTPRRSTRGSGSPRR